MFTETEYHKFQVAFDRFNNELFDGALPQVLITFARKKNAKGYLSPESFKGRETGELAHEIAMNPDSFRERSDIDVLSTLVHEMAHHWQQEFGKPPRKCYHDKQWAGKMEDIGLIPSSTGEEGGKRTGPKMTHYIERGGRFEAVANKLLSEGWKLDWEAVFKLQMTKTAKDKIKYLCPACAVKAWAKDGVKLVCGECGGQMEAEL